MRGPLAIPKRCKNPPLCRVGRIFRYRTRAATGRNNYARYATLFGNTGAVRKDLRLQLVCRVNCLS